MNRESVDAYLARGCGRCDRFDTPECKVHGWAEALGALRALLAASELTEEVKWGAPCYTLGGKNVAMLSALVDHCALSFFKGAILEDPDGVLEAPGPNSRYARLIRFRSMDEVAARRDAAAQLIAQAIEVERAGKRVDPGPADEPIPDELLARLDADPLVGAAWEALTPGRRRSHVLYVSAAKKAQTREARVERCVLKILAGKGYNER